MGANAFTIPSIFTAINKFSSPVKAMGKDIEAFASKAEAGIARGERLFRKLTPSLSGAAKEFLSFATTAAVTAGIIAGITFSVSSLKDYETAVASFRTIVGGSDQEFAKYQQAINDVAKDTKKSSIETAGAFEKVASLNAKFAETAQSISSVSSAAITLSKASKDELGSSAESLVGIMNQFSLGAEQADRTINVLAAGAGVGAASIIQTAEAFKNFGSVAAGANISLEQSTALVQTLGKFSVFGAEAGTKLRGSVLKLQQAGVGYASGQFQINDALAEAKARIDKLQTAKLRDAALTKMFGAENIATGRILLSNIDVINDFTKGVTGTSLAHEQAAINSNTLTIALDEMKNSWINIITSNKEAGSALSTTKNIIRFITNNMETLVSIGVNVIIFFAAWKAILIASKIAMIAYNIVYGINNALQGKSLFYTQGNVYAKYADLAVTKAITAAQWLWNTAMMANPIGLVIAGIVALIAVVILIIAYWNEWGAALSIMLGPLGLVISLIQSFRRNWDMITESFSTGGVLAGFQAIGATILDAILMPLQQVLEIVAKLTGADWASKAAKSMEAFRKDMGVNVETDESGNPLANKEMVNPKKTEQEALSQRLETIKTQKAMIEINDKTGRASVDPGNNMIPIKLTSTVPVR